MIDILKKLIWGVVLAGLGFPGALLAGPPLPRVYILDVAGTVAPGMAAYIERALAGIEEDAVIVFKMDTFGGRVDEAFKIVEVLSSRPRELTVAYVEKRAISAGALIALASGTLIMKQGTLIGDCAPIIQTSEGHREAGEKMQTVLRAQFRTLAKRNGYPVVLAESMVSKEMEVFRVETEGQVRFMDKTAYDDLPAAQKARISQKRTVVPKGKLLTMDDHEARELGFSKASVRDLDQALSVLGLSGRGKVMVRESWSERLVKVLQPFLPLLMLIGIGAVYTEIKAPGFGVPGIIGIVCLGLVFFNQYLVGLADYTEALVLIIGVLLLGIEIFVLPGFGIAGITGLAVIAAGLVLSFQGFVLPDPALPWEAGLMLRNFGWVMGSFLGALAVSFLTLRFILPKAKSVVKGPYLDATLADARVHSDEAGRIVAGDTGVTLSPLRPAGKIRIRARKVDAITQGSFIGPDTPVTVIAVTQNHVIVQAIEENS